MDDKNMLPVGTLLQMGKYRIENYLSSGGFGNTYVVTNTQFEERYALKEFFIKGISERDGDHITVSVSNKTNEQQFYSQREKFKKEARRLRKLYNPHIVKVHDLFEENGTAYYVMDFIDGESISEYVKRTKKCMTEDEALNIMSQVLDALAEVHSSGIRHLDLKPANIMLDKKDNAIIIDFGASKQLDAQDGGGGSTSTSSMCYTAGYAPSEQMDQKMDLIGAWTDLYALGGTLYYMLTQQLPPTISEMQEEGAFCFPKNISTPTRNLVLWMMQPNRTKRPQSVEDVLAFLKKPFQLESFKKDDTDSIDDTIYSKKEPSGGQENTEEKIISSPSPRFSKEWRLYAIPVVVAFLIFVVVSIVLEEGRSQDAELVEEQFLERKLVDSLWRSQDAELVEEQYFESSLGVCFYTGPVDSDGNPHGTGEVTFADNRFYFGPFVHGKFEGDNAYFCYDNGDTFEGAFRNNSFDNGKYTIKADGSYFVGQFSGGQPASGQWYDKNGNKI